LQLKVAFGNSGNPWTHEGFRSWSWATHRRFISTVSIVCS
jgi:hypothetical protein